MKGELEEVTLKSESVCVENGGCDTDYKGGKG